MQTINYNSIGLGYAAKKIVIGQDNIMRGVRSGKASLVLISNLASENTKKVISDKCKYYEVEFYIIDDNGKLAKALGKDNVKVISVINKGFKRSILNRSKGE
ncbi:MAG: L7Ae/L30e/S12e/Gadd45 family ribosomal protein [Mycoplasmatales bacterium]